MISGKSYALIRAACSVSAGSCALTLGQETHARAKSTYEPGNGQQQEAWLKTVPLNFCVSAKSTTSTRPTPPFAPEFDAAADFLSRSNGVDDVASSATEAAAAAHPSVVNSVQYWALVFKNLSKALTYPRETMTSTTGDFGETEEASLEEADEEVELDEEDEGADVAGTCLCPKRKDLDRNLANCGHRSSYWLPSPSSFKEVALNTVTASRHLFLVRHGQYHTKRKLERDRCLTRVGREQLRLTGKRLKEIGTTYSKIAASTMKRAQESAQIILDCIGNPDLPFTSDSLLEEGAPIVPEPPLPNWRPNKRQFQSDGQRIEAAFLKYFRKADMSQAADSHEIIVCHANVIRYFVCRALEVPPEAWLRMWLNHGSITWLTIRPSGRVTLNAMGASGYMPPSRLTAT